ncbi:MAG: STAS domain-containing protein [Acidobacteriaceae bacterium]|nr:STAS domain-containing protein [Acidobacteriaceae bacterium]MBV9782091.1 STAS domain-containing protein [Acidobacteriaceae bacterium]
MGTPLNISSHVEDGLAVLDITGDLTLGPSLTTLREAAKKALDPQKIKGLVLRVEGVTTTDSAGLGELTVVYTFASKRDCPIAIVGVTPALRKMLEMTHLDALLPSASDVASAKKQFQDR